MKKVGIAIDRWKLSIFKHHLEGAGYTYDTGPGVTTDAMMIAVETEDVHALEKVVRAANNEAARSKMQ